MNILKNFSLIVKLKSFTYLKKSILCVKPYSKTIYNKNFCNPCLRTNKKYISKNKIQYKTLSTKTQINSCQIYPSINFNSVKNKEFCYQAKDSLSVAIVGGGSSTVYSTILLKQNPAIKEIHVIDTDNSLIGAISDIKQIDTNPVVIYYKRNNMLDGLHNIDIVALMDETHFSMGNKGPFSQFESSSNYVKYVAECMINTCPRALIAVFTRPVTATLPLVSEIYKLSGNWNPNKIVGSAALESMRISAMTANLFDLNPSFLSIPIAGGIDSLTVVPLLSRTKPFNNFTLENQCMLTHQLRSIDKNLYTSESRGPTLSSGLAAAKFISILINGLKGQNISIANAYVRSDIFPSCLYMTSELQFGTNGIEQNFGLPKISSGEILLIEQAAVMINKIVNSVTHFVHTKK